MKNLIALAVALLLVGCNTLPRYVITLTETMDSASKEYARVYNSGLIPANVHDKAIDAHATYQKAAGIAADALRAYKLSGDNTQYIAAFQAAQLAANNFVTLIYPLLSPDKSAKLKLNVTKASAL